MGEATVGIYDFGILPFALGDVFTWNVQTAIQCDKFKCDRVDTYVCVDRNMPACVFQRDFINYDTYELLFNELYVAFATNPRLGNIHIYRSREQLLETLRTNIPRTPVNTEAIGDYIEALSRDLSDGSVTSPGALALRVYFEKYIYSHRAINAFAAERGTIPLLQAPPGCDAQVRELVNRRFAGKRLVPFHMRLRQLDVEYSGEHSYQRDSNFLEWYDFLVNAMHKYPNVEFIALGRVQEKPLEILKLPNVTSLRVLGMGLGHELAFMLQSDFFIGTSSGFAALANFSKLPYFITKVTPDSCKAYDIPYGQTALPFAFPNQKLVSEPETSDLLMRLLKEGLESCFGVEGARAQQADLADSSSVASDAQKGLTSRFFTGSQARGEETVRLLLLGADEAKRNWLEGKTTEARRIVDTVRRNYADLCRTLPEFLLPAGGVAIEDGDVPAMVSWHAAVNALQVAEQSPLELVDLLKRCLTLALERRRQTPDFAYLFPHLKAKLQHVNLRRPLRANGLINGRGD